MFSELQKYSTQNQLDQIRDYAKQRGLEIVRTYANKGKSGLSLNGRAGLKQLTKDLETGDFPFQSVLVFDVSRSRRFQVADESAYY